MQVFFMTQTDNEHLKRIEDKLDKLSSEIKKSNERFDSYRQLNQSLINLAYVLIFTATFAFVFDTIFNR